MWRGYSVRILALMIAGPMLMDLSNVAVIVWMGATAVRKGIDPHTQMWIGAIGPGSFCLGAQVAQYLLKPRTALRIMTYLVPVMMLVGMAPLFFQPLWYFVLTSALIGFLAAQYFVGFQYAMDHVRPFRLVAWSVAFYNIAWGAGFSIGSFLGVSGTAWDPKWFILYLVVITTVHLAILVAARTAGIRQHDDGERQMVHQVNSTPAHRMTAWICGIATAFVVVGTSGVLWLYHASATGLSALQTALGVFAFAVAIPLMTPLLAHFRLKMIRPAWMITALPVQAAALIAIWWVPAWPWHLLPLGVMGIAASMVYYQCVYYANADEQTHTRSVSINEAALAIGSMTGPLALGLIAWEDRTAFRPYGVGAAVLVLAAVVAAMVWMRRDRTASA